MRHLSLQRLDAVRWNKEAEEPVLLVSSVDMQSTGTLSYLHLKRDRGVAASGLLLKAAPFHKL